MRDGNTETIVHLYADRRGFVIAPLRQDMAGEWREYQPVQLEMKTTPPGNFDFQLLTFGFR